METNNLRQFDVEICLPVFLEGKWQQRLHAFRRSGLLNISDVSVRLVLLAGTQDAPDLNAGWPVDEVEVFRSSTNEAASKIYSYYHHLSLADLGRARWFLRIDDDSSTNVQDLILSLDRCYWWREAHHLMAWQVSARPLPAPFPQWLHGIGYSHIVSKHFMHDWEVSVTSQTAMLHALSHSGARELLRRASQIEGNWGDIALAICCRLVGISPVTCSFLDAGPVYWDYSAFGGEKHHIHGIAPDIEEHWASFQQKLDEYYPAHSPRE